VGVDSHCEWSFIGGSRVIFKPKLARCVLYQKSSGVYASCNPFLHFYYLIVSTIGAIFQVA
jgi:hypothetical protein